MNKTIIGIYGRANEGKSETIKQICRILISDFPNAVPTVQDINYSGDILIAIQIGEIKIGLESQGDPNSRMVNDDTLKKLADTKVDAVLGGCDIIICATRTGGQTVQTVDDLANHYDYHSLWISSFWSPTLNSAILNKMAAANIINIIKSLVIGQL
jgi:hypothetical protein